MDKSVAGFFLPIAVHIIGCIVNFRNLLWGHPTWVNVLVSTCCILFGFLFPLFARRWPFAVTVTAVLAGFLLLSRLLVLGTEVLPGLLPFATLFVFAFYPPASPLFIVLFDGFPVDWTVILAVFALVWLVYLICLRRSVRRFDG